MNCNIPADVLTELISLFERNTAIDKVEVFGSRARGDHTPKSDIDLAIYSKTISKEAFKLLQLELSELPIFYYIDSVHFENATQALRDNIKKDGIVIFTKHTIIDWWWKQKLKGKSMTAIGVILGIFLTLGLMIGVPYYSFSYLHTTLKLGIFESIVIVFVAYTIFIPLLGYIYKIIVGTRR